jgi:hypothetical protein
MIQKILNNQETNLVTVILFVHKLEVCAILPVNEITILVKVTMIQMI